MLQELPAGFHNRGYSSNNRTWWRKCADFKVKVGRVYSGSEIRSVGWVARIPQASATWDWILLHAASDKRRCLVDVDGLRPSDVWRDEFEDSFSGSLSP